MPRTNYLPDRHTPIGYAMTYQKPQHEDKPTVEVDLFAEGLQRSLIEAVCVALETWDPVFDHWEPPSPRFNKEGKEISSRMIPVFRGRDADKVLKFREDIFGYMQRNPTEQDKNVFVKIASKYVRIRPTPHWEGQAPLPHQDTTHYARDVIRPVIRRSDPEWDVHLVVKARRALASGDEWGVHAFVLKMLQNYDTNHGTVFYNSYMAETEPLDVSPLAPSWEHWRLAAHYVQDITDARYSWPEIGLHEQLKAKRPG
jgi:hypothetical protein